MANEKFDVVALIACLAKRKINSRRFSDFEQGCEMIEIATLIGNRNGLTAQDSKRLREIVAAEGCS
jgi:hypothetical protein